MKKESNQEDNFELMVEIKKGVWSEEEDQILLEFVRVNGPGNWSSIQSKGLLPRTGKSCRLRWVNKLQPGLKSRTKFSPEEERVVLEMQPRIGNKWATIAKFLPGRTDNDVKNFWSIRNKRLARLERNNELRKQAELVSPSRPIYKDHCNVSLLDLLADKASTSNGQESKQGISCVHQSRNVTSATPDQETDLFNLEIKPFALFDEIPLNQPCFSDPFMFGPVSDYFDLGQNQFHFVQPSFDDLTSDVLASFEQPQPPRAIV